MSTPQRRPRTDPDSTGSPSASRSRTNAGEDNSGFGETKNINVDGYGPNIQPMEPENKYPHNDTDDSQTPPPYAHISHMDGRHNDENQRKMPHRITEGTLKTITTKKTVKKHAATEEAKEMDVEADTHFVVPCIPYCFK